MVSRVRFSAASATFPLGTSGCTGTPWIGGTAARTAVGKSSITPITGARTIRFTATAASGDDLAILQTRTGEADVTRATTHIEEIRVPIVCVHDRRTAHVNVQRRPWLRRKDRGHTASTPAKIGVGISTAGTDHSHRHAGCAQRHHVILQHSVAHTLEAGLNGSGRRRGGHLTSALGVQSGLSRAPVPKIIHNYQATQRGLPGCEVLICGGTTIGPRENLRGCASSGAMIPELHKATCAVQARSYKLILLIAFNAQLLRSDGRARVRAGHAWSAANHLERVTAGPVRYPIGRTVEGGRGRRGSTDGCS